MLLKSRKLSGRQLISTLHGNVKNSEEILTLTNYGIMLKLQEKRIELVSPDFTTLRDGKDNTVPQIAAINSITITSGGYEDE